MRARYIKTKRYLAPLSPDQCISFQNILLTQKMYYEQQTEQIVINYINVLENCTC